jgi:hypothetical protein
VRLTDIDEQVYVDMSYAYREALQIFAHPASTDSGDNFTDTLYIDREYHYQWHKFKQ